MITERAVRHDHAETSLESVLVMPASSAPSPPARLPGLLLIHEFTGLDEATLDHARRLASMGFVVFAADFYGPKERPYTREEARLVHRRFRNDRLLMRDRASACLQAFRACPEVNDDITALGLSFGGGAVLELARTGAPLSRVISIYGYLDTSHPIAATATMPPLAIVHVQDDPVVPEAHCRAFQDEMNAVGASVEIQMLDGVRHGFMNPNSEEYDAEVSARVWESIAAMLETDADS